MEIAASDLDGARTGAQGSLRQVIDALATASPTLQMFHGPEAMADGVRAAGAPAIAVLESAADAGGAGGVAAARALWLANAAPADTAVRAAEHALSEPRLWWHGVFLGGEVGPLARPLAPRLAEVFELCRGLMPAAAQAYVRTAGMAAVDRLGAWLGDAELAPAAASAAGGLGRDAVELVEPLGALLREGPSLAATSAAVDSLCRTCPDVGALASHAHVALGGDRWLRMWTVRRLAEVGQRRHSRGEPRDASRRDWWGTFFRSVPLADCADRDQLAALLVPALDDADTDVVRNTVMALAAIGAVDEARRIELLASDSELAADVADALYTLGAADSASGVAATDLYVAAPPLDRDRGERLAANLRDAIARSDHLVTVDEGDGNDALLRVLADDGHVMFHGSSTRDLEVLEPTRMGTSDNPLTDQVGVFGDVDPVIPHFYAVVDRTRARSITNGRHDTPRGSRYHLALDLHAIASRTFTPGSVYVLPRDTFTLHDEWASPTAVRPLAEVQVRADDYPLLADLWSSDLGKPINDAFDEALTALWHTAHFPSRRS